MAEAGIVKTVLGTRRVVGRDDLNEGLTFGRANKPRSLASVRAGLPFLDHLKAQGVPVPARERSGVLASDGNVLNRSNHVLTGMPQRMRRLHAPPGSQAGTLALRILQVKCQAK